jgi:predicted DNA-binding transcriptional regulator AlpA
MLQPTREAIRAILRADPTLAASERARLLETLRQSARPLERNPARLLRRAEVAARLAMSVRGVDRLCAAGILPKRKLPGHTRASGIPEEAVENLIRGGTREEVAA